jgi:hypothetical protein
MRLSKKLYSIKKADDDLWKCGLSAEQVRAKLAAGEITEMWLVCEFGRAKHPVTVGRFEELVSGTAEFEGKAGAARAAKPTYVHIVCVKCQARIRVETPAFPELAPKAVCGKCRQAYALSAADSDGAAILIVPVTR